MSARRFGPSWATIQNSLFLLTPGLWLKRWVVLSLLGLAVLLLGIAFAVELPLASRLLNVAGVITLQGYSSAIRGGVFLGVGVLVIGVAGWGLYSSLARLGASKASVGILRELYIQRILGSGPQVVAIGGGTGLATLLRGMKHVTSNITAIVTVADDGGSSGRIRTEFDMPPPGDIRSCLVALADSEATMQELMDYRFPGTGSLAGHSLGNLLITALSDIAGSFEEGVERAGRILAVRGRVLPCCLTSIVLVGETVTSQTVVGESNIGTTGEPIRRVYIEQKNVQAYPESVLAIEQADLIVLGPGSLYTSIVANLLVPGIAEALRRARGLKVYVCNVAVQPGETDNYSLGRHVDVIAQYGGEGAVDIVMANNNLSQSEYRGKRVQLIPPDLDRSSALPVVIGDLLDTCMPTRHDPWKLARALADVYRARRGGRRPILRRWQMRSTS